IISCLCAAMLSSHSECRICVFREDGIISGYRHPRSSALDCILSSFQMNNETINIWTHFLPTWYFLWRFCVLCSTLNFLTDSYTWPLLVYMMLICVYPFTSSCAHTFSTMSAESRHICYFFDYGALSLYSLGCAISYGYYVMPECWVNTWLHQHFVPIAIGNTVFCTSLSCYSRFLELQCPKRSKALRTIAFVVPFIFDTVPLIYRVSHVKGDRKVKVFPNFSNTKKRIPVIPVHHSFVERNISCRAPCQSSAGGGTDFTGYTRSYWQSKEFCIFPQLHGTKVF
uniref:Progestin and adipoQ receptor family member VI n=1 Tax=Neolamprologus brichardi TaxID=32507 RepID=A0A3Q4GG11_NEOBR